MIDSESNFQKLLLKDGSAIEQVLSESDIEQAWKSNSQELRLYLSKHLPRLIRIAFREDTNEITLTALKMLTGGNRFVIPNLVKSTYFPGFVTKTLAKAPEISSSTIGRICDVTLSIFQSGKTDILHSCGYILMLLQYSNNPSVYSMFQTILSDDNQKMEKFRDWLFNIGFIDEISSIILECMNSTFLANNFVESDLHSLHYAYDHEKLINLLKLVSDAAKNRPEVKKDFISSHLKSILIASNSHRFPNFISDHFWKAINTLYDSDLTIFFTDMAYAAQSMIILTSKNSENQVHLYLSESLDFISKIIESKPELVTNDLLEAILTLMGKFSRSSFFLCDVRRFFQKCITIKELKEKIPSAIAPKLLHYGKDKSNGLVSYFAIAIIEDMTKSETAKKTIKKIDSISKFIKRTIDPLSKKREQGYTDKYIWKDTPTSPKRKSSI